MRYRILLLLFVILFSCSGMTKYYNRDGWGYQVTVDEFKNRLVVSEKEAVLERAELEIPEKNSLKGKAIVKVLVDVDGHVQAAVIEQSIAGIEKELIQAARKSKYAKVRDHLERPSLYVTQLAYIFR